HCDLKPTNIVVDVDGHPRVLDFGLAVASSGLAGWPPGPLRGSPRYMAPEQISGEPLSAATDVYAIGVVLYEMLTGAPPFTGETVDDVLAAVALGDAEPPSSKRPGLGAHLDALCLRCLHKQPGERPPNGRALARSLGAVLEGPPDAGDLSD